MTLFRNAFLLIAVCALAAAPMTLVAQNAAHTQTIQMALAYATLSKPLDAKKAKQGDPVTAKLVYDVKIPGAAPLPRNTLLLGHIDQVQASKDKSDSFIEVTFDTAQPKNGQPIPIKATILNISETASPFDANDNGTSSADDAISRVAPRPMLDNTRIVGTDSPNAANPVPEQNPDIEKRGPGGTLRATHVKGVTLQSDINQSYSGVVRATRKNVYIPSGADLALAVAEVPIGARTQ